MTNRKWTEAKIVVGDRELTFAEAMTVRVALNSYVLSLSEGALVDLQPGIRAGYLANCESVLREMANAAEEPATQVVEPDR